MIELLENAECSIPIAGIQGMTTIDYPGHLAAVFFTKGCTWNCRYCQNAELRHLNSDAIVSWDSVITFLESRAGFLEGIVISGGEPTVHASLPELLSIIRRLGYKTALHTNGFNPSKLEKLLAKNLVDYVAMDIKGPPKAYDRITQSKNSCLHVSRSIRIIVSSGVDYEFRTTYHPAVISEEELLETMKICAFTGVKRYYLQKFRKEGVGDPELVNNGDVCLPESAVKLGKELFPVFETR
jgi:pyruvate formate lyase activating enzyme